MPLSFCRPGLSVLLVFVTVALLAVPIDLAAQSSADIPLPEHPRPDHQRASWINLNGEWQFRFAPADAGLQAESAEFDRQIMVPFSWGAPLSGVPDEGDIGWYRRQITVPDDWSGRRVFLVIGAADWTTTAWLDGEELGSHRGGYTPFEFELTPFIESGSAHTLVVRIDDTPHDFKLEGKQGYGPARGIWQTPYLEARGALPVDHAHFSPDIIDEKVDVEVALLEPASSDTPLELEIDGVGTTVETVPAGADVVRFDVPLPDPHLWTLDDPHLYDATVRIAGDTLTTYFGMRSIGVVDLPATGHPYIALNGEPIYLEMALDQAYHPEGFYTFPSDEFTRDEVLRSRQIGLNAMRVHVKIALPRKLYWADRLGILIMADVPNSWGRPGAEMRREVEYALEQMIERDYNHPSIFAWVPFNESWGLKTPADEGDGDFEGDVILPETQEWVASVYREAKEMDPTRLVEDNSVCCFGHTETDINSWHVYTAGYSMAEHLDEVVEKTYPGSEWNFLNGRTQARQPLINSEFGNVWGYEGSTGDVDWSWDYHIFINEFRRRPRIAGWLYTEHHDVVNEWNGYWRYDRSEKFTGMEELAEGMTLRDLHAPFYVAVGEPSKMAHNVSAGEAVEVPLWASFMTGSTAHGSELTLEAELYGWDTLGRRWSRGVVASQPVAFTPWRSEALPPMSVTMPEEPGVAVLATRLSDAAGIALQRNFTTFIIDGPSPTAVELPDNRRGRIVRVAAADVSGASWSMKQWDVLDGLKMNGAGSGYFEYTLPWPADIDVEDVEEAAFVFEASAKQLFGKDRSEYQRGGDYMRGQGSHDPSLNPNAYPMTDETRFASAVTVSFGGEVAETYELRDDPADHRGILSWHAQPQDRRLREAGSYGWLIEAPVPQTALRAAAASGELVVRLEVDEALPHGLAIYGAQFGRYPVDPSLILVLGGDAP